jgi:hypothetical protein
VQVSDISESGGTTTVGGEDFVDVTMVSGGSHIPTIADRGTTADIVSKEVAMKLVGEGIVDMIHPLERSVMVQFGVESAKVPAVGVIYGQGLVGEILVVEGGLPVMLISDITFTEKGVVFVEDNTHLFGIARGRVVVVGMRDGTAPRTATEAMWRLDLRAIMREADPRIEARVDEAQQELTAREIVALVQQGYSGAGVGKVSGPEQQRHDRAVTGSGDTSEGGLATRGRATLQSYGARPTYSIEDIRKIRAFLKACGISPFTVAITVEQGALSNVPGWLTPAGLRAVGYAQGNVPAVLSTARRRISGGTGIREVEVGRVVSFDIIGMYVRSLYGAQYGAGFRDEASGFMDGYALRSKADLAAAFRRYCQMVEYYGQGPVRAARTDAGAEAIHYGEYTAVFRQLCAELHIVLLPAAPGDQRSNPIERAWQTISHRMANMLLQQINLVKSDWVLVWFAAIVHDRCVCHRGMEKTPYELMCGFVPDVEDWAKFFTGQTVMFPAVKSQGLLSTGHQVGVYILPMLPGKASLVRIGDKTQVRSGVRAVGAGVRDLTAKELAKLAPKFDQTTGDLLDFQSRAKTPFSLRRVVKDYDLGVDLEGGDEVVDLHEVRRYTELVGRQHSEGQQSLQQRSGVKGAHELAGLPLQLPALVIGGIQDRALGEGEAIRRASEGSSGERFSTMTLRSSTNRVGDKGTVDGTERNLQEGMALVGKEMLPIVGTQHQLQKQVRELGLGEGLDGGCDQEEGLETYEARRGLIMEACHAAVMSLFGVPWLGESLAGGPKKGEPDGGGDGAYSAGAVGGAGIATKAEGMDRRGIPGAGLPAEDMPFARLEVGERAILTGICGDQAAAVWEQIKAGRRSRGEGEQSLFKEQTVYAANKMRVLHNEDNPTSRMLEQDEKLAALWQPCTHKEISDGLLKGYRILISDKQRLEFDIDY